jgi:hypothetical protein
MRKYLTEEWVGQLQEQVERHLVKATVLYQNLTEEELLTPPPNGGWSVAQCLDHLNSYGHYYIPAIKKAILFSPYSLRKADPYFKTGLLGNYFTKLMKDKNGIKFTAFKDHLPSSNLNGAAVVAEFINQQEQWLKLLGETDLVNLNKIKVPISISKMIKLKLGDVFGFVKAHDERHLCQADRVLLKG